MLAHDGVDNNGPSRRLLAQEQRQKGTWQQEGDVISIAVLLSIAAAKARQPRHHETRRGERVASAGGAEKAALAAEGSKKSLVGGFQLPREAAVASTAPGGNRTASERASAGTLALVRSGAAGEPLAGDLRRGRRRGSCGCRKGCTGWRRRWRKRKREKGGAGMTSSKRGYEKRHRKAPRSPANMHRAWC